MNGQNEINQETLDALANAVFYAGFGAIGRDELSQALVKGTDEFQVIHDTKMNTDSVRGVLHFKRSEQDLNKVYFNSFDLLVKKADKEEILQRNFPVFFGNKYTLKEGYNLLDGRSVQKTFTKINPDNKNDRQTTEPWVYLDFKSVDDYGQFQIDRRYHYDLEKELQAYPIKGMEYSQNKKQLMDALKKGDRVQVVMNTSRGEETIKIEASPKFGSINIFDENGKRILLSMKNPTLEQDQQQTQSQGQVNSTPPLNSTVKEEPAITPENAEKVVEGKTKVDKVKIEEPKQVVNKNKSSKLKAS